MSYYHIQEVDGVANQDIINEFNALAPEIFPALESRHFSDGFWFIAYHDGVPVAFAGMVPFEPFVNVGYLKRCFVKPDHHGHGLQHRMMINRELKARQIGWTHLVSECLAENKYSAANFRRAGFEMTDPEQKWGAAGSLYWIKALA